MLHGRHDERVQVHGRNPLRSESVSRPCGVLIKKVEGSAFPESIHAEGLAARILLPWKSLPN